MSDKPKLTIEPEEEPDVTLELTVTGDLPGGGKDGQVLTKQNGKAVWADPPAGGGGGSSEPGEPGKDGGYYVPSVNDNGDLSWTPSNPDMPVVPETNIKGKDGKDADVTAENVKNALGYTPADAEDVASLSEEIDELKATGGGGDWGADNALKLLYVAEDGETAVMGAENGVEVQTRGDETDESIIVNLWQPDNYEWGSINASTGGIYDSTANMRTKDFIEVTEGAEYSVYCFNFTNGGTTVVCYDADKARVSSKYFSGVYHFAATGIKYIKIQTAQWSQYRPDKIPQWMLWRTTSSDIPAEYVEYGRYDKPRLVAPGVARNAADILANRRAAFDGQMLHIAYSTIELAIINSAEHFLTASKLGFNALKCDVQPTSDGELVLCHDPGYTFDDNGRILQSYDANNFTAINTLTAAEIAEKEYAGQQYAQGYYTHPCFLEDFIRICKEKGMVAFVTIRDDNIPDVVAPKLIEIVKKYGMEDHTIVNSFNINSLKAVRNLHKTIYLHQVKNYESVLTNAEVDAIDALGNAMISMYVYPASTGTEKLTASESAIAYAKMRNVRVYNGQIFTYEQYQESITRGISGVQIAKPILPYKRELYTFKVKVENGAASFVNSFGAQRFTANVSSDADKITVSNIAMLGSTRGFPDGILPIWMYYLPYTMSIKSASAQNCNVTYSNHAWHITSANIAADDTYTVCVEI